MWPELSLSLPPRTYLKFATIVGVKETTLYSWDDMCRSFKEGMALRVKIGDLSPRTQTRYESVIREFETFLKERQHKIWLLRELENKALVKEFKFWRVKRIEANWGIGSGVLMDLGVLHTIFQYAIEEGMMEKNPVRLKYKRHENPEGGADPYSSEELAQFRQYLGNNVMKHCPMSTNIWRSNVMVFLLLLHTGLRESDAASASFMNIDFDARELDIVTQKFGKRVIQPLHSELMAALKAERDRRNANPSDTILINPNTGKPFKPQILYTHVVRLGERAGVPNARPHQFRDSKAADLFLNGASTPDVAEALGDSEEVIKKHYAKWIPERRERLRRFVENRSGLEGYRSLLSLEGVADDIQQKQVQGPETSEPQSPLTSSEMAAAMVLSSNVIESEKNQQDEQHAVAILLSTSGENGKAQIESGTPAARGKAPAKRGAGVIVHGTRSAYVYHKCRCEVCGTKQKERCRDYRERLKKEGRPPGTMVTLVCDGCGIEFQRRKSNRPAVKGRRKAYCPDCWPAKRRNTAVGVHSASNVSSSDELPVDQQEQVFPEAA